MRAYASIGDVFDIVINVGGFGQDEEELVIQSDTRLLAAIAFMFLGLTSQMLLAAKKKKQFERLKLQ